MRFSRVTSFSLCWIWQRGFLLPVSRPSCPAVLPRSTTLHPVSRSTLKFRFALLITATVVFNISEHGNLVILSVYPGTPATPATPANIVQGLPDWASQITNTDTVAAVAQILQSPQGQQVSEHILPKSVYIRAACVAVGVRRCLTYFVVACYSSSSWCRVCRCSSRSPNRPCCRPWMLA